MSKTPRPRGPGRPSGAPGPAAFTATPDALVRDTATFQAAAVALFGRHGWVRDTALCMGVNEATVWRWINTLPALPGPALAAMTGWVRLHALTGEIPRPLREADEPQQGDA